MWQQNQCVHLLDSHDWRAYQNAEWATCKQYGLLSVLWKRRGIIGGGPIGQNFGVLRIVNVMSKQVLVVQLPPGTGMSDTGCRPAVGGHYFHVLLQATMDSFSWPYIKEEEVAFDQFGPVTQNISEIVGFPRWNLERLEKQRQISLLGVLQDPACAGNFSETVD